MYERYWGLKTKPFDNTPDPKYAFLAGRYVGTPRKINNLCDMCLLLGFTRNADLVDVDIVDGAHAGRFMAR